MKIEKLRSSLEVEEVSFVTGHAILVHKTQISEVLEKVKSFSIPRYLKRVKFIDEYWFLILVNSICAGYETIKVAIPEKMASTEEQYLKYKEIWPCVFYKRKEEEIQLDYVKKWATVCAENQRNCLIVDNDRLLSHTYHTDDILGHCAFKGVDYVNKKQYGYLCTGFDAFLSEEPCLSCAMSLVHGRIRRVFCLRKGSGVYSKLRFNYCKEINHRYDVYFINDVTTV